MSKRFTFTWTEEQVVELIRRAKVAGITGDSERELIYKYFCRREHLEPVRHGGIRPGGFESGNQHGQASKHRRNKNYRA